MRSQKTKHAFRVSRGVEQDYKTHRLRAWALQAHNWDEFTKENLFHGQSHEQVWREVLSLRGRNGTKLIDLGCGSGRFLRLIRAKSEVRWVNLVGIDFCNEMLNLATALSTNSPEPVAWHHADLELPIDRTAIYDFTGFDIATAIFLLDEVEDVRNCFESAKFVLRPGGYLVCGMLDPDREKERYNLPDYSQAPVTVIRPITIGDDRLSGEYYRLVRPKKQIYAAAASVGLVLHLERILQPSELGVANDGPALRIIVWKKPETRRSES